MITQPLRRGKMAERERPRRRRAEPGEGRSVAQDEADQLKAQLEEAGATLELK